ncbi:MAG: HPr family phosphocarrier protein [Firmicutes bacterium HGW-Firmicutes-3]|jgi:phosphocarrier protein|nr:MAG: HPr family phosphocarrier protein [Firmicutes bacterium HGW-Firmicutes-3]
MLCRKTGGIVILRKLKVTVIFEEGLHARPASQLTKICQNVKSDIKMSKNGNVVNPKSILGILSLGARYQDELEIEISGEDEDILASNLEELFKQI